MYNQERWEYGSEFHWFFSFNEEKDIHSIYNESLFLGTGRCALKLIINWGRINSNWKRIWIPSYFCPEVTESVLSTGINTVFYHDDPIKGFNLNENCYLAGDVILINNLFGYRSQPQYDSLPRNYVQIIEDHSHDPWSDWSIKSKADWCFASLRKSLPISDGAILWSPLRHILPQIPQLSSNHYIASLEKLIGMILKSDYLQGKSVEKEYFRNFLINGEKRIGTSESSCITKFSRTQLNRLPVDLIRKKKNQNRSTLINSLINSELFKVLEPSIGSNSCPFSVILYFNSSKIREIFLNSLVEDRIYPAILWPDNKRVRYNIPHSSSDFNEKMLSIHCDFRYSAEDIYRVSEKILTISSKLLVKKL